MEGTRYRVPPVRRVLEQGRREAVIRSSESLRREGFTVSDEIASHRRRGAEGTGLLAANGGRVVRVIVLLDKDIDSRQTQARVRAAYRRGETRVFVRWPLRWRMLSNVARWGLRGVAVSTW